MHVTPDRYMGMQFMCFERFTTQLSFLLLDAGEVRRSSHRRRTEVDRDRKRQSVQHQSFTPENVKNENIQQEVVR